MKTADFVCRDVLENVQIGHTWQWSRAPTANPPVVLSCARCGRTVSALKLPAPWEGAPRAYWTRVLNP